MIEIRIEVIKSSVHAQHSINFTQQLVEIELTSMAISGVMPKRLQSCTNETALTVQQWPKY